MKQTLGRFLMQANRDFPADCEMLDYMQTNLAVVSILGNIVGDKTILQGCELEQNGTRRKPGYVFLKTTDYPDGEVIYWEGGAISGGMYLKQDIISVDAQGNNYPQAYVSRSLAPGIGLENYKWPDFKVAKTPAELEAYDKKQDEDILKLAPQPLGIVQLWAGESVPANYALCEGQQLRITEYPDLYAAIGTVYNSGYDYNGKSYSTVSGYFRLPDLRSRFIVGYSPNDSDYNAVAKVGGRKTVALTTDQLPAHGHAFFGNVWRRGTPLPYTQIGSNDYNVSGDSNVSQATDFVSAQTGGGAAHENRPPYYTLAYIMRLK